MSQDREYANEISGSLKSKNLLTSKYKIITAGGPSYSCDLLLTYLFNLIRWKVIMLFFFLFICVSMPVGSLEKQPQKVGIIEHPLYGARIRETWNFTLAKLKSSDNACWRFWRWISSTVEIFWCWIYLACLHLRSLD